MGSGVGAVLVETPAGHLFLNMAAGKFLVAVLLLGASDAKRTLRGNARPSVDNRDARSLVNMGLSIYLSTHRIEQDSSSFIKICFKIKPPFSQLRRKRQNDKKCDRACFT